jgi:formate/nitrite transporter
MDDRTSGRKAAKSPQAITFDAILPAAMAIRAEESGVKRASTDLLTLLVLGLLAGAFISFGAILATTVSAGSIAITTADGGATLSAGLPYGVVRLLTGLVFSLGLILVVVGGAELFTGNNLLAMAWASKRITSGELAINWTVVYLANFLGALGLVALVYLSGHWRMDDGAVGANAVKIALAKATLPFWEAFFKGILCNILVCLAVWLALAGRSVADKILAIVFPISAFVAAGFEHSIANMYFIPLGILVKDQIAVSGSEQLSWTGFFANLLPVTIGNIIGGGLMVALVYYLVYRRRVEN